MKRILLSVMVMALLALLVGGGLFAHFTDTESSEGNSFTAGTLDLKVDGEDFIEREDLILKPCVWQSWDVHDLTNSGQLDGILFLNLDATEWVGGDDAICDLEDYLEVIVCYCTDEDLVPVVQGADNIGQAIDMLRDADKLENVMYSGLLKDVIGWKPLGDLIAGGTHHIQILVHLQQPPDANKMMGDYAVVDKIIRLDQSPCEPPGGGGKGLNLPDVAVDLVISAGSTSYLTATLSNVPAGYDVTNGAYLAWCLDDDHYIYYSTTYSAILRSSYNPTIYGYDPDWSPNAFDYVNYLINTYDQTGGGLGNLQRAIWYFVDGIDYASLPAGAKAMVDDALANGSGYEVPSGGWELVICFNGTNVQFLGIEVDP